MTTTGARLAQRSLLPTGTAIDHLLALRSEWAGGVCVAAGLHIVSSKRMCSVSGSARQQEVVTNFIGGALCMSEPLSLQTRPETSPLVEECVYLSISPFNFTVLRGDECVYLCQAGAVEVCVSNPSNEMYVFEAREQINTWYGVLAEQTVDPATLTAALMKRENTGCGATFSFDCSDGGYFHLAYPASFGEARFRINGLVYSDVSRCEIPMLNPSTGHVEPYVLYYCNTIQYGKNIRLESY